MERSSSSETTTLASESFDADKEGQESIAEIVEVSSLPPQMEVRLKRETQSSGGEGEC
jgi:hypothetical protein